MGSKMSLMEAEAIMQEKAAKFEETLPRDSIEETGDLVTLPEPATTALISQAGGEMKNFTEIVSAATLGDVAKQAASAPVKALVVLNILACAISLVLLAWLDRGLIGAGPVAWVTLNLLAFAGCSTAWLNDDEPRLITRFQALIGLMLLTFVTGLAMPVQSSLGPAFAGGFLTTALVIAVSLYMLVTGQRRGHVPFSRAWALMGFAMLTTPLTVLILALGVIILGWPLPDAIPSGIIGALVVNPLAAYALIIHGAPSEYPV